MSIDQITDLRAAGRVGNPVSLSRLEAGTWRALHALLVPALLILGGFWLGAMISAEVDGLSYSWMVAFGLLDFTFDTVGRYSVLAMALIALFWIAERMVRLIRAIC